MFARYKNIILFSSLILATVLLVILGSVLGVGNNKNSSKSTTTSSTTSKKGNSTVDIAKESYHLKDDDTLYSNQDDTSVQTMYLTVSRGNSAENTNHSWSEINNYSVYDYEKMNVDRYQIAGLLQVGDSNGPIAGELGYGQETPNATVQIRGQTSSRNPQKNYKIELKDNKGDWNGQKTINLNKHVTDSLRFRNKLAYTLLEEIPQLISLRTQFVHLYVKDTTGDNPSQFVDYGLYTQVEQLNKTGMKAHNLDSSGQLYKLNFFEFTDDANVIKLESDPDFNKEAFEEKLEIKGSHDHQKLIDLIKTINDSSQNFDDVLSKYFDVENLSYWMAFQILMGNKDTQSRNMFLYSPLNSERWYILDWDNDGSLYATEGQIKGSSRNASWETGISNYWGNALFRRALKTKSFRKSLDQAIEDLRKNYLTTANITDLSTKFARTVEPYISQTPDSTYLGLTTSEYTKILSALPSEVEANYQSYKDSLEKPMPFFIGVPTVSNGKLKLNWDSSYDFGQEDVTYTVEVSDNYDFSTILYKKEGLRVTNSEMDLPSAGQYFIRVTATNASGKTQVAFDYYVIDSGKISGVKSFHVNADQTISEDVNEE